MLLSTSSISRLICSTLLFSCGEFCTAISLSFSSSDNSFITPSSCSRTEVRLSVSLRSSKSSCVILSLYRSASDSSDSELSEAGVVVSPAAYAAAEIPAARVATRATLDSDCLMLKRDFNGSPRQCALLFYFVFDSG